MCAKILKKRFVYKQDKKIKQLQEMDENLKQAIEEDSENLKFIERQIQKEMMKT